MAAGGAQVRVRSQIDPPCLNHPDTEAAFVCEECEEALACPKCIVKGGIHSGHIFTPLQDLLDASKTEVLEFNKNTKEQVLGPMKKMAEKITACLLAYEGDTAIVLKEIEKRGDQLHFQVDQLVTQYKQRCGQTRASNREVLMQYQHDLPAKIAEVEQDIATLEDCIQATCKADIINAAKTGISKTYPSIDYPRDTEVSFQQSELPLQDMKRFLGTILIGNKPTVREETDEEKIKRMESEIQELTNREKIDKEKIKRMESEIQELTNRLQRLQANTDGLTRKLKDQKKDAEKREKELEQKIKELKRCSDCGAEKGSCTCRTCPKCSYKGNNFRSHYRPFSTIRERERTIRERRRFRRRFDYECPKCRHIFLQ